MRALQLLTVKNMYFLDKSWYSWSRAAGYNTDILLFEGENYEDTELSEQHNEVDTQYYEDSEKCTLVYDSSGQVVCAESLVIVPEDNNTITIEQTEEQQTYNYTVLDTIQQIRDIEQTQLESSDTVALMEIYTDIQDTLDSIYNYLNLFIGLYLIGWIFAQLNSWRRNNKHD